MFSIQFFLFSLYHKYVNDKGIQNPKLHVVFICSLIEIAILSSLLGIFTIILGGINSQELRIVLGILGVLISYLNYKYLYCSNYLDSLVSKFENNQANTERYRFLSLLTGFAILMTCIAGVIVTSYLKSKHAL